MAAKAGTKAGRKPGKKSNAEGAAPGGAEAPITSPVVLSPVEAFYLGKSLQKKGKQLEDAAKARGALACEGEREIDVDLRLVDRPITKKASLPTAGFTRVDASIGMGDLFFAYIADECGADATKIDAFLTKFIERYKKVKATEKGDALLANVAEMLPAKVDEHARLASLTTTTQVPGSPGGMGAVTCDPTLQVKKFRRAE